MMSDFDEWVNTLSPESKQKFFAKQQQIKEDCERVEAWIYRPKEAMKLTPEQIAFLELKEIHISTAYIGMVRLYLDDRTIFQTSAMASIANALVLSDWKPMNDYDDLTRQVHEYLNLLMSASPEIQDNLLNCHMPLFGAGELDEIRGICQ